MHQAFILPTHWAGGLGIDEGALRSEESAEAAIMCEPLEPAARAFGIRRSFAKPKRLAATCNKRRVEGSRHDKLEVATTSWRF